ncbi:hypothetical protein [Halomonas saccharevitans]|uniref:Uncharacterized protein n=1 Tax=Halomonas saccharevitans TaxID=416872 RepID=A0A1I7CPQ5_9GAMM|nr:hypothetical protein [Halomonas saccharevitans]SFU01426.1 hypothetical protein SAMN04487956_1558 [Halomonas saccharevitans]
MAQSDTVSNSRSIFERHLQTGIQLLLVALLGWAGLKLVTLGENTAVLRERLTYQSEQLASLRRELRNWSDLYYRKGDAARELGDIKSDIASLEARVTELESDS